MPAHQSLRFHANLKDNELLELLCTRFSLGFNKKDGHGQLDYEIQVWGFGVHFQFLALNGNFRHVSVKPACDNRSLFWWAVRDVLGIKAECYRTDKDTDIIAIPDREVAFDAASGDFRPKVPASKGTSPSRDVVQPASRCEPDGHASKD